jgi:hypothetical protein
MARFRQASRRNLETVRIKPERLRLLEIDTVLRLVGPALVEIEFKYGEL